MNREFKTVQPFELCGIAYARIDGRSMLISERAFMDAGRARDLRDWITSALPEQSVVDETPTPADFIAILDMFVYRDDAARESAMRMAAEEIESRGATYARATVLKNGSLLMEGWRIRPKNEPPLHPDILAGEAVPPWGSMQSEWMTRLGS